MGGNAIPLPGHHPYAECEEWTLIGAGDQYGDGLTGIRCAACGWSMPRCRASATDLRDAWRAHAFGPAVRSEAREGVATGYPCAV